MNSRLSTFSKRSDGLTASCVLVATVARRNGLRNETGITAGTVVDYLVTVRKQRSGLVEIQDIDVGAII